MLVLFCRNRGSFSSDAESLLHCKRVNVGAGVGIFDYKVLGREGTWPCWMNLKYFPTFL